MLKVVLMHIIGESNISFGRIGGNTQFTMMEDQFFLYDSSVTAPLSTVPLWPYTLQYRYKSVTCVQYCAVHI